MQIKDGLLIRKTIDDSRTIVIPCQEQSIATHLHEVAVWWKRSRAWVKSNEVGDGMQVVQLHDRPFMLYTLDPTWLLYGMSLYQEYNESSDNRTTYLYKFSKDADVQARLQNFLEYVGVAYTVEQQDRFIVLEGENILYPEEEKIGVMMTHAGHAGPLSFLCGLLLAYGQFDMEGDVLHTARVTLPLLGTIAQRQTMIEQIVKGLAGIGIYMTLATQDQSHGQVMQLTITDWELLKQIQKWCGETYGISEVSKYTTYEQMKESLLERIRHETGDMHIEEKVGYSVMKLLRK